MKFNSSAQILLTCGRLCMLLEENLQASVSKADELLIQRDLAVAGSCS